MLHTKLIYFMNNRTACITGLMEEYARRVYIKHNAMYMVLVEDFPS